MGKSGSAGPALARAPPAPAQGLVQREGCTGLAHQLRCSGPLALDAGQEEGCGSRIPATFLNLKGTCRVRGIGKPIGFGVEHQPAGPRYGTPKPTSGLARKHRHLLGHRASAPRTMRSLHRHVMTSYCVLALVLGIQGEAIIIPALLKLTLQEEEGSVMNKEPKLITD